MLTLLLTTLFAVPIGVELIADPDFEQGFKVYDPKPGKQVVRRVLQWGHAADTPVWGLAQWSSKHSLAETTLERLPSGTVRFADPAKTVTVGSRSEGTPRLSLALDGRAEWGTTARKPGEPWPHLLVSQRFSNDCPRLDALTSLDFSVSARLARSKRFEPQGYDPHIHAAQFLIFFTVQNLNRESPGYGDFLWLGVPVYDDRDRPELSIIGGDQDHGKLIYTPARADYTGGDITSGEWVTFAADLLPLARRALAEAWQRGFLKDSQAVADYRLGGMNMGWEMTGSHLVEMEIRDLGLRAIPR